MSGLDEILPWAIENYPPEDYTTFDLWYNAINNDFMSNNRSSLDKILDPNEIDIMIKAWDNAQEEDFFEEEIPGPEEPPEDIIPKKKDDIQTFIEDTRDMLEQKAKETAQEKILEAELEKPTVKKAIQESVKPSLLRKIASFFKGLLRR